MNPASTLKEVPSETGKLGHKVQFFLVIYYSILLHPAAYHLKRLLTHKLPILSSGRVLTHYCSKYIEKDVTVTNTCMIIIRHNRNVTT